jgi:DNA-binding NtrC family response regulator
MDDRGDPGPRSSAKSGDALDPITGAGPTTAPVVVIGSSAAERESVARAVHRYQRGQDGLFLRLQGAQDDSLLRHALQGWLTWVKGDEPPRLLARLDGGSLFLDQIEGLAAETQKLLLEFLKLEPATPETSQSLTEPGRSWRGQMIAGCETPLRQAVQDKGLLPELADCLDKVRIVLDPDDTESKGRPSTT